MKKKGASVEKAAAPKPKKSYKNNRGISDYYDVDRIGKIMAKELENASYISTACQIAGISFMTYRKWFKLGKQYLAESKNRVLSTEEKEYVLFMQRIVGSSAKWQNQSLKTIKRAGDGFKETRKLKRVEQTFVNVGDLKEALGMRRSYNDVNKVLIGEKITIEDQETDKFDWRASAKLLSMRKPEKYSERRVAPKPDTTQSEADALEVASKQAILMLAMTEIGEGEDEQE